MARDHVEAVATNPRGAKRMMISLIYGAGVGLMEGGHHVREWIIISPRLPCRA